MITRSLATAQIARNVDDVDFSSSSSSSSNESDLGGAITLLLQDHRTTNKSVCKQPEHSSADDVHSTLTISA